PTATLFPYTTLFRSTLVQQHDDGLDAGSLQLLRRRVGGLHLVEEVDGGHAAGGDQRGGALQRHPDEAHVDAVDGTHLGARQQGLARVGLTILVDHVGGQPLEVGAGVRLVREVAAVDRVAATVLHAQQLGGALVELVVAHRADVEADRVEALHGRFVVEQTRQERRAADEVTGRHGQGLVGQRHLAQVLQRRGQVLHPTDEVLLRILRRGQRVRTGLEVAVVVVERQQLHVQAGRPRGRLRSDPRRDRFGRGRGATEGGEAGRRARVRRGEGGGRRRAGAGQQEGPEQGSGEGRTGQRVGEVDAAGQVGLGVVRE